MFAIVDIETTGGSPRRDRITEIAIFLHNGSRVVEEFASLINPEVYIPPYITRLTGISNEMVENAPRFYEVARKIVELTENTVFVAHNVQFDYRFVQSEFKRLGFDFNRKTLCTVRMSRKSFQGFPSYSLGVLCQNLGIEINDRHRAAGDALATTKVFDLIIAKNPELVMVESVSRTTFSELNPNLDPKRVSGLPEETGVYYFYDQEGKLLYVGKSKNIRSRIMQHLTGAASKRALEMRSRIADIDFELTGSELVALLVEADQIKQNVPIYNKRGRRSSDQLGVFSFFDEKGYLNLKLNKLSLECETPLASFPNTTSAKDFLLSLVDRFNLCQKLCGLYTSSNACFHYQIGQCRGACVDAESPSSYNIRVQKAVNSLNLESRSFLIIDSGRNNEEKSFVKVVNGKIEGFGYFDLNYVGGNFELLTESITPCGNHKEAFFAIRNFLAKAKAGQVIPI